MSQWDADATITHPTRTPWVRDRSFRIQLPPVLDEYFDRVQDQLGAFCHAALGWQWSMASEEFDNEAYPAGYLGGLRIIDNINPAPGFPMDVVAEAANDYGECGVWSVRAALANVFRFQAHSAASALGGGDCVYAARVKVVSRPRLDVMANNGIHIGLGDKTTHLPAFACGGDQENWHIFARPTDAGVAPPPAQHFDTGIPLVDDRWDELQISRVAGAVRFHINGALCRFVIDGEEREGIYLPEAMTARRYLQIRRWALGPVGDGLFIDYFHCLRQRSS